MRKALRAVALLLAVGGVAACAYQDRYGYGYSDRYDDYWYDGDDYAGGSGAEVLDPWLALTPEGRDIVAMGFGGDGRLSEETAHRANIWFRRYADTDDDLRLTDEEIRLALVQGSRDRPWTSGY